MYESFVANFSPDDVAEQHASTAVSFGKVASGWDGLFRQFSGHSFRGGLYRIHRSDDIGKWNEIVSEAFPDFRGRIICFAYDWLGRHFALDKQRIESGEPLVLMLEPGTGEILEIPVNLMEFHNTELVEYADEALAVSFFKTWLGEGKKSPSYDECVGYKKPLFLGGTDTVDNLEVIDLEVYWGISAQLIERVRGLPPGTPIQNISIS